MFGFKKRFLAAVGQFMDVLAVAIGEAALQEQKSLGQTEDRRIAAAVSSLLIGRESPLHTDKERRAAKELATVMLKNHADIRFAAVQCLRTTGMMYGTEATISCVATIDWIGTIGEIPGVRPDFDTMNRLAYDMAMKYCPGAIQVERQLNAQA